MDGWKYDTTLNEQIIHNEKEHKRILAEIKEIEKKINSGKRAERFKAQIDSTRKSTEHESQKAIKEIVREFQAKITIISDERQGKKIALEELDDEKDFLIRQVERLEPQFREAITEKLQEHVIDAGNALIAEYKAEIESLYTPVSDGVHINPSKLMESYIALGDFLTDDIINADDLVQEERVKTGEEWVKNTDKKWYKPWTWFQESGHYRDIYKTFQYVPADEFARSVLKPIQIALFNNGDSAINYAKTELFPQIVEDFMKEFSRLNDVLKEKLAEKEQCITDKKNVGILLEKARKQLAWLKDIQTKIDNILEI